MKKEIENINIEIKKLYIKIAKLKLQKAQAILDLRKKGLSFQKIGRKIGVSRQRIHQIISY